jgi:hypothetical protein
MSKADVVNYLKLKKAAGVNELCKFARTSGISLDHMVRDGILDVKTRPYKLGGRYKIGGRTYRKIYSLKKVRKHVFN